MGENRFDSTCYSFIESALIMACLAGGLFGDLWGSTVGSSLILTQPLQLAQLCGYRVELPFKCEQPRVVFCRRGCGADGQLIRTGFGGIIAHAGALHSLARSRGHLLMFLATAAFRHRYLWDRHAAPFARKGIDVTLLA